MRVEFDWQVENDDGEWETIATSFRERHRRRGMWRVWVAGIATALVLATGTVVGIRHQYQEGLRRIEFQIQSVIDLEARAQAQGNRRLFLAQQDSASPSWYAQQAACVLAESPAAPSSASSSAPGASQDGHILPLPAQLQSVDMRGDVAWVEVTVGEDALRQVRFYRQTGLGWKHTAPEAGFFGEPVELQAGPLRVLAYEHDLPYLDPLIEHVVQVVQDLGTRLGVPAEGALTIQFTDEASSDPLPHLCGDTLTLASPWLSGIPAQGNWGRAYLDEVTYLTAYGVATRFVGSDSEDGLKEHQRAVLGEYVDYYVRQDLAQTPLLRPVVEKHGVSALPEVLRSIKDQGSVFDFIDRWLFDQPPQEHGPYFEVLWHIRRQVRDCMVQEATCQLFRALDRDYRWMGGLGWYDPNSWPYAVIHTR